ncbi:MAG: hypothetical protein QOJ02_3790 [Acidobacteriota bacterium]|jgi:hypothetical protein|nr:hypothetical protein [Acidobacteriota bacterium]
MTLKGMLAIFLGVCAITTFGYWRYCVAGQPHAVAQFGFIRDPSDSIPNDCGRIVSLAERALAMPETGEGSTITLFVLGNKATANEPQLIGEFQVPVIHRVIEGKRAANREKQELLTRIKNQCSEIKEIRVSPIFQAVKRSVEHLQTVGAAGDSRYLFVQSDGEETENLQIKNALNGAPVKASELPAPIQNRGVHVTFCGMAETIGEVPDNNQVVHRKSKERDSKRADHLREVWAKLFTSPELVSFEPYCSRESSLSSNPSGLR